MAITTVAKLIDTIGGTGAFATVQLWEDGAPANLTTSNNWAAGTFTGTFQQGETVTGVGITGGKFLDSDGSTYITFGTTTTPAAGITATGSTSLATCILSGSANVGIIWQGQLINQETVVAGTIVTLSGSTTSSSAYKELRCQAGASFADNANKLTNPQRYSATAGAALRNTTNNVAAVSMAEQNVRLTGLQIQSTGTDGRGVACSSASGIVDSCIIEANYTGASNVGVLSTTATGFIGKNLLCILRATGSDHVISIGTVSPAFYGCFFVAPDDLVAAPAKLILSGASGSATFQNCGLWAGDSSKAIYSGTAPTFTTCYSDISGTTGVTQGTYTSEFQNVNDATRDYRLKTGAAEIGTGTTDATNTPNDIVGTARTVPYDVGSWKFTASGFFSRYYYDMARLT